MSERVLAYFFDRPGSALDKACQHIFEEHGGRHIGSGILLVGPSAGERDVEYDMPDDKAASVKAALTKAGFRLTPTEIGTVQ